MELNEFVSQFAEQFEETESSEFSASTVFKNLDEWSSLQAMLIITMIRKKFGKTLKGPEVNGCNTIEDLYNCILKK